VRLATDDTHDTRPTHTDHAFGAAAGFKAIDIGIERAQQYGVAAVGVINSTYSPFCSLWMSDLLSLLAVVVR
jgi:LDH2 family malate/lactate/ureidoglycolate dehydrogenase